MKRGGRHLMLLVLGLIFVAACTPSVPEQYIQPDDMEDILYDYHVSQGMAVKETGGTDYYRNLYFKAVLEKYGVTQEEFDSSLVYYYTRADKFISMYKNVQERLTEEALVRGASVSEVNRYTSTSLSGDTADIWEGQRTAVLMAQRPYHLMQFYQKADTSYHAGDSFLMTFGSHFLSQGRNRTTTLYVAVTSENDSGWLWRDHHENTCVQVSREGYQRIRGDGHPTGGKPAERHVYAVPGSHPADSFPQRSA